MKILFFGGSNRDYVAVQVKGLRENGVEVLECPDNRRTPRDDISSGKIVRKHGALSVFLYAIITTLNYARLAWRHMKYEYDIMLLNTSGIQNFPIARLLSRIRKRPLVYSAWVSVWDALTDRGMKKSSIAARVIFWIEKKFLRWVNLVIVETETDKEWFCETFGLPPEKVRVVYVGADDSVFYPKDVPTYPKFNILFYATQLPIHGIETVLAAREILKEHHEIKFRFIGPFEGSDATWVSYEKLADEINWADVVLGIFGNSPRTLRFIPNKVFQPIACAKPVITADTPAMREAFVHGESAYLIPAGDPKALANAILDMRDAGLRERIATGGYEVYQKMFTPEAIGRSLKKVFEKRIARWLDE